MDEVPDLLVDTIGDAPVIATVNLGGGDAVVVTPERTHLYRSEGLLSDESIETYTHDVDRLSVDAGRRKSSIHLETIEGDRGFTVPSDAADAVVEGILEGILRTTGVIDPEESVEAQFRFSELTLVVTDRRLLRHVGGAVWDEEFETFPYEALTDLDFEEGSVATQVVVATPDRRRRVKVPNDHAVSVRTAVQGAVFEYHGVSSLGGLRAKVAPEDDGEDAETADAETTADGDDEEPAAEDEGEDHDGLFEEPSWSPPADQDVTGPRGRVGDTKSTGRTATDSGPDDGAADGRDADAATAPDAGDIEALAERVDTLTAEVEKQRDLLEHQQETIERLVDELRRGR